MTKKNIIVLTAAFLAVAGFYLYLYRDSFHRASIQISHTIRPRPAALMHRSATPSNEEDINNINFGFDRPYKLTSIKVVPVPELATNEYAHPVWELTTDSNSAPIRVFSYGMHIRGMHPTVKGATPSPLTPNVPYRLFVAAGKIKGEHDFTVTDESHLAQ